MAREIRCLAELDHWIGDGRLSLDGGSLQFRGAEHLSIDVREITAVHDDDGWLVVQHPGGTARFDLGHLAPAWVNAITKPRSRADRMGVDATSLIGVTGPVPADLVAEFAALGADVRSEHAPDACYDMVFLAVHDEAGLDELAGARAMIRPSGAVWLVRPRDVQGLADDAVARAAEAAGLVENRGARVSDSHTALRFIIPRALRGARA